MEQKSAYGPAGERVDDLYVSSPCPRSTTRDKPTNAGRRIVDRQANSSYNLIETDRQNSTLPMRNGSLPTSSAALADIGSTTAADSPFLLRRSALSAIVQRDEIFLPGPGNRVARWDSGARFP
ncbi:hypothetical protein [Mesorhizobium sp. M0159]|uniref:hypothetical protein n=1 Tax=Mesorhizobium sp. M0159 TaxID=2956900 RepID=UPI003334F4ED